MTHVVRTDGIFNSWNRQPFIWERVPGQLPNLTPKPFVIERNFLVSNCKCLYFLDLRAACR